MHNVCQPTDLDLFDLETGLRVASKVGTFLPNLGMLGFGFSNYSLCMQRTYRRTDGRTKAMLIAPFPMVGGITIKTNT